MERKRRMPARAATRASNASKKRNVTPKEPTPAPTPPPVEEQPPSPPPPPPPSLPTSLEPGQDLPVVDEPQPEDLSAEDYQSVLESGVLQESLTRSRSKWINDGLFEKYWTKPHKRKGVVQEDPKNPPKESMMRVGNVTLNIEPHIVEATMYVVRAPKPPPGQQTQQQQQQTPQQTQQQQQMQQTQGPSQKKQAQGAVPPHSVPQQQPQHSQQHFAQQQMRPIIQYGPPGGSLPSPVPKTSTGPPSASAPAAAAAQLQPQMSASAQNIQQRTAHPPPNRPPPSNSATPPAQQPAPKPAPPTASQGPVPATQTTATASRPPAPQVAPSQAQAPPKPSPPPPPPPPSAAQREGSKPPAAGDPVIALLAKRATSDEKLRDIMKRVAVGEATPDELAIFQRVIDQLNRETRATPPVPSPAPAPASAPAQAPQASAKELFVDGKSVQYFADEVRTILDIVLASNPNQKSSELRPPPGSDPLVVLLVKTALEDGRTRDIIRRIAEGRMRQGDVVGLKEILDRLHRDTKIMPMAIPPQQIQARGPIAPNGHPRPMPPPQPHVPQQKAPAKQKPPPAPKPDIAAVVFDFGTGDRYLFPKYSILEFQPSSSGQQVLASFLIVRKGSTKETEADPKLDFYQPVTIRLSTATGRALDNLARVVAPYEEVCRYMDEVMDTMTRGEYLLLAMRLPRPSKDGEPDGEGRKSRSLATTPAPEVKGEEEKTRRPEVLWRASTSAGAQDAAAPKGMSEEEEAERRYQRLIATVAAKDVPAIW